MGWWIGLCRSALAVMKDRARPIRDRSVLFGNRLDSVMGGDEEGSELSEPLKVEPAVFVKLAG